VKRHQHLAYQIDDVRLSVAHTRHGHGQYVHHVLRVLAAIDDVAHWILLDEGTVIDRDVLDACCPHLHESVRHVAELGDADVSRRRTRGELVLDEDLECRERRLEGIGLHRFSFE
jgi:hypothetical protein